MRQLCQQTFVKNGLVVTRLRNKYYCSKIFFLDKSENASQATENVNSIYAPDIETANHSLFMFRWFLSGSSDVKDAPSSEKQTVENIDKIIQIVKFGSHVNVVWISQELSIKKNKQKTIWVHISKAG